jgi:hypothetical protein
MGLDHERERRSFNNSWTSEIVLGKIAQHSDLRSMPSSICVRHRFIGESKKMRNLTPHDCK